MANLTFKGLGKTYPGGIQAISNFNLEIQNEEFIIMIGPSGCGKSTLLRMIAGLEDITEGTLSIDDQRVNDVEPKDRDIAMVFQNYALYPHMTVYENMAFGLKMRKTNKKEIEERVKHAALTLGIEDLLSRKPKALSGGQRQRVALGRAIVRNPKVFLMDEPLSNLDAKLRVQTRAEIVKLHRKLKTTFIYVTHDQTEAMTMGDKIVVLKDGVLQQFASPQELYERPINLFVAGFIGSPEMNFLSVEIVERNDQIFIQKAGWEQKLEKGIAYYLKQNYLGKTIIIGIRPEDVLVGRENACLLGKVDSVENMGSEKYLYFQVGKDRITAKVSSSINANYGDSFPLSFVPNKIHFFDPETENRIE